MAHTHEIREPVTTGVSPAVLAARAIYFAFGVVIAFIVLRMVLLLLGANQANAFVDFVYAISGVFVMPFFGIFAYAPSYGVSTFEISSLVAIIIYTLIAWGLASLVTLGSRHRTEV
ncbi:YggT family protein [Candidatus Saccharibacteria bacterium]|nr:YggT family protein [Candidatus Saccharibacteria bacterium]